MIAEARYGTGRRLRFRAKFDFCGDDPATCGKRGYRLAAFGVAVRSTGSTGRSSAKPIHLIHEGAHLF